VFPIVEFTYNHSMYGAMRFSPFEVVYSFNLCVSIDLVSILINEMTSMAGIKKEKMMKKL